MILLNYKEFPDILARFNSKYTRYGYVVKSIIHDNAKNDIVEHIYTDGITTLRGNSLSWFEFQIIYPNVYSAKDNLIGFWSDKPLKSNKSFIPANNIEELDKLIECIEHIISIVYKDCKEPYIVLLEHLKELRDIKKEWFNEFNRI